MDRARQKRGGKGTPADGGAKRAAEDGGPKKARKKGKSSKLQVSVARVAPQSCAPPGAHFAVRTQHAQADNVHRCYHGCGCMSDQAKPGAAAATTLALPRHQCVDKMHDMLSGRMACWIWCASAGRWTTMCGCWWRATSAACGATPRCGGTCLQTAVLDSCCRIRVWHPVRPLAATREKLM